MPGTQMVLNILVDGRVEVECVNNEQTTSEPPLCSDGLAVALPGDRLP